MKILVGYVDSPEGGAAMDAAVREALLRQASLTVFQHVRVTGGAENAGDAVAAQERLREVEQRVRAQGVECEAHWSVGVRSPAAALLAYAEEQAIDLIVLGIRRRSPVGKLVLGSNAQDVLLGADCPVLAVKAPDEP